MSKAMREHQQAAIKALNRAERNLAQGNHLARAVNMSEVRYHQAKLRELIAKRKGVAA